jgi:hypothetical protein
VGKGWVSIASLMFLVAMSVMGLALIPVLVLAPNLIPVQAPIRHGLAGTLYIVTCILGISAVFYPKTCNGLFGKPQSPLPQAIKTSLQISGHHPDCQNYSANRIKIGGRVICAACGGLLIGATTVFVGAILHFFVGVDLFWSSFWLLALGEILMFLGLVQLRFARYFKLLFNVIFVAGSFVTLVEADLLAGSILVDLYVLALIVFMLWFRILLSEWNNRRICQKCQLCLR